MQTEQHLGLVDVAHALLHQCMRVWQLGDVSLGNVSLLVYDLVFVLQNLVLLLFIQLVILSFQHRMFAQQGFELHTNRQIRLFRVCLLCHQTSTVPSYNQV